MIKIAFFDIDGTILRMGHKELTEKTALALNALRDNGVLLCMATGRGYPVIPHFEGVDFDVFFTFNGSYVRAGDNVIYKNPLDDEDKRIIIRNLKQMKRAIAISNEKRIVTNGTGVAMDNAKDEVKAKADCICPSVDDDGVYRYCLENGLIQV